mmetsp:Transcript_15596/g.45606  ORF Transcript_15596/g.45606 Transcript_15596/m.45606 type:complete len:263 (-) Transcript_15596:13-801(-)
MMSLAALLESGFLPTPTPIHVTLLSCQALVALTSGRGEFSNQNAKYSKFAAGMPGIPSRQGMLVIYAGGLLVSVLALAAAMNSDDKQERSQLVAAMLFTHYAKRELEVMFVHRYSGNVDLGTSCMISVFYGLAAMGLMYFTPKDVEISHSGAAGAALFIIGVMGNAFHHLLLASLRSGHTSGGPYVIPRGGLFGLVTCPHYLFELVTWLGVAMVSHSLYGYLNFFSMVNYLSGRAYATREWYMKKFGDAYPTTRKALVPFVF